MTFSLMRMSGALLVAIVLTFAGVPGASAKKAAAGPVMFDVPDDFKDAGSKPAAVHQDSSGITIEAAELPLEALNEFKGPTFLDYLQSLGYANPAYADGALKRTDAYTYVIADAKGAQGPETRYLLVIGGNGRAAIVTAYAPNSEIANGHASRAAIEAILDSATVVPGAPAKP